MDNKKTEAPKCENCKASCDTCSLLQLLEKKFSKDEEEKMFLDVGKDFAKQLKEFEEEKGFRNTFNYSKSK